ncbi:hypothetical protein RND71_005515 [Anisodus tanguticus]|uniref:Uncharacterized protein n=1 Tax=Anisodus tanguticus TaxID=243964 RepID=A0AAE1SSK3_9SOLA|nr:hypothetical protein RND71_005515 [Anisodus tanguticus]
MKLSRVGSGHRSCQYLGGATRVRSRNRSSPYPGWATWKMLWPYFYITNRNWNPKLKNKNEAA